MKKVIFTILGLLFLCSNFSFAADPLGIPGIGDLLPSPILWELKISDLSSIPTSVYGAEEIIIRGTMESYKLSKSIPAMVNVAQKGSSEDVSVSDYIECMPKEFIDPITDSKYYQGTCDFSISFIVDDKGVPPEGKEIDYAIRLYQGKMLEVGTKIISTKEFSLKVFPWKPVTTDNPTDPDKLNVLKAKAILEFAERITNVIFGIIVSFAFIAIVLGGFLMITSAGDPTKVSKARNTIFFALAGFALASLSKGIVALIQAIMGVKEKSG